jgi:hypothetical protein
LFQRASLASSHFFKASYPFHRGRHRIVLNPALVKSRLSLCHSACRPARPFAPSPCDLLVVDEASMDAVMLTQALVEAIPDDAAPLIVGDIDQLPSVGAGPG